MYKIVLGNKVRSVPNRYIAMDRNVDWYSYVDAPEITSDGDFWDNCDRDDEYICRYKQEYIPWNKTLIDLETIGEYKEVHNSKVTAVRNIDTVLKTMAQYIDTKELDSPSEDVVNSPRGYTWHPIGE